MARKIKKRFTMRIYEGEYDYEVTPELVKRVLDERVRLGEIVDGIDRILEKVGELEEMLRDGRI